MDCGVLMHDAGEHSRAQGTTDLLLREMGSLNFGTGPAKACQLVVFTSYFVPEACCGLINR